MDYEWPITCSTGLDPTAHQSKLLSIKDVIRDLQAGSDAIMVLSAIRQNVLYEKETKLEVEGAIPLRGAA
jgi:hypothetical protein